MEMGNILTKCNNRVICKSRFLITKIVVPIVVIVFFSTITTIMIPRKIVFAIVEVIPGISDKWKTVIGQLPLAYFPFVLLCYFVLYLIILHKVLGQKQLLPANYYFLVPSWMIKVAYYINWQHEGSATSIPIWQFCEYLYHKSDFAWRGLKLEIPDVMLAESGVDIEIKVVEPNLPKVDSTVLSIIISDTYSIDFDSLPSFVTEHRYEIFQTLKEGKLDRVRRYNPKLVAEIISQIRSAETEGVKSVYLLLNTNPKLISEVFREIFTDAGRNPIEHLYIYESQSSSPYYFTNVHLIF